MVSDLANLAVDQVYNAASNQLEPVRHIPDSFSIDNLSPLNSTDDLTASIYDLCAAQNIGTNGSIRCSDHDFLTTIADLSTDNYLAVENMLRTAEQRPRIREQNDDAAELRLLYSSPDTGDLFRGQIHNLSNAQSCDFPQTFKRALQRPDKNDWMRVALDEWLRFYEHFQAMVPASYEEYIAAKRKYGSLVCSPIPMKWVFTIKYSASTGEYNRHKARLVAAQSLVRYSVDDKWSPTLSLDSMKIMLVLACLHDADIDAMDVSGAYLSGKLDDDDPPIFLMVPQGLDHLKQYPKLPNGDAPYCFKAKRSIYGLQSAQALSQIIF